MAKSTERTWALFKVVRAMVYTLATISSLALGIIYGVLIARGFDAYQVYQRVIVILLLTIYTISAITFYSMLILRFRLILDGIRLVLLFLLQVGGTVTFALSVNELPCVRFATPICKLMDNIAIFGGYSLAGLVLLFSFYLISMHYVPVPTHRMHPEALLALQLSQSQKSANIQFEEKREKRPLSVGSDRSIYSQRSLKSLNSQPRAYSPPSQTTMYQNHSPSSSGSSSAMNKAGVDVFRSKTPGSHYRPVTAGSMHTGEASSGYDSRPPTRQVMPPFEHYRPQTPAASIRSVALTSASSIRTVPRQMYNTSYGIPAPQPRMPLPAVPYPGLTPLTHAFSEPIISRHGTPMTTLSNTSFYMPATSTKPQSQGRQRGALLSPPGLATVGEGMSFPHPPTTVHYNTSARFGTSALPVPYAYTEHTSTPVVVQLQNALRMRNPSPAPVINRPVQSEEDFRALLPSRSPSTSSVPRSPSPDHDSFTGSLPTTPRSGTLPARPGMSPAMYTVRYGATSPDGHRERFGSTASSTISLSPSMSLSNVGGVGQRARFGAFQDIDAKGVPGAMPDASNGWQYYNQQKQYQQQYQYAPNRYHGRTSPQNVHQDWIAEDRTGEIDMWRQNMERKYTNDRALAAGRQ